MPLMVIGSLPVRPLNVGDVAYAADGDHLVGVPDRPPIQLSRLRRILEPELR